MKFTEFLTTKAFFKQAAIALLISLLIMWVTLLVLKAYTRHNDVVTVPKLVGLSMNQIGQMETARDFDIVVTDSIYDYTKAAGSVISQDPQPGTHVKPDRSVYVSLVSFIPEQVAMPSLNDLSLRQAKALLQTYGLKLGTIRYIPDMAQNAVIQFTVNGKFIKPGVQVRKGSMVDLMVGSGKVASLPEVPFLIGKTREEASNILKRLGFYIVSESFSGTSDSTNARVYTQVPEYAYHKTTASGTGFSLTYQSSDDIDFDEYIQGMNIDTIQSESSPAEQP